VKASVRIQTKKKVSGEELRVYENGTDTLDFIKDNNGKMCLAEEHRANYRSQSRLPMQRRRSGKGPMLLGRSQPTRMVTSDIAHLGQVISQLTG